MTTREQEFYEIGEWDWWYAAYRPTVLHSATVTYDPNLDVGGDGVTACGRKLHLWIPGIFSRMSMPRCRRCCERLGFPQGNGSPKNDKKCRPLVKRRLRAAKADKLTAMPIGGGVPKPRAVLTSHPGLSGQRSASADG